MDPIKGWVMKCRMRPIEKNVLSKHKKEELPEHREKSGPFL